MRDRSQPPRGFQSVLQYKHTNTLLMCCTRYHDDDGAGGWEHREGPHDLYGATSIHAGIGVAPAGGAGWALRVWNWARWHCGESGGECPRQRGQSKGTDVNRNVVCVENCESNLTFWAPTFSSREGQLCPAGPVLISQTKTLRPAQIRKGQRCHTGSRLWGQTFTHVCQIHSSWFLHFFRITFYRYVLIKVIT